MNRKEHLKWAKDRALELVREGNPGEAFSSLLSDLGKHEETEAARQMCLDLGGPLLTGGHLSRASDMRNFIEGFN